MGTGASYAIFNSKQLAGTSDFGANLVSYVRAISQEAVAARWNVDGVFSSKLVVAASGANKVQITGSSKGTDGIGHILDITQLADRTAQFQNTNAILYYVGMFYADSPTELRINPRTGAPQYVAFKETIGVPGTPDLVTDNGNGTITFRVDSVTEAGVTNVGRTVRVYKKAPASGALTLAIAVEDCAVAFGANNTITTVGNLGQTFVSTTASDYVVVLLGISVKRNTDLRGVQGCCFLGTVTGNGGTPTVFSNVDQVLLQTFSDASQITYAPTLWLSPAATTVDVALNTIVSGLLSNSSSTPGAFRVGVYPNDFVTASVATDTTATQTGGIGTLADGTLSASATVEETLRAIDKAIRRDRAFKTGTDSTRPGHLNKTAVMATMESFPDCYFLKKLVDFTVDTYLDQAATVSGNAPYVVGENCLNSDVAALDGSRPKVRMNRDNAGDAQAGKIPGGHWERVQFDTTTVGKYMYLNGAFAPGGIYEDVLFRGSNIAVGTADTTKGNHPLHVRNFIVDPLTGATRALSHGIELGTIGTANLPIHGLFENGLIRGPASTQTTPAPSTVMNIASAVGQTGAATLIGTGVADADRPLKFSNTMFVCQNVNTGALNIDGRQKVVFDNCHFHGITGMGAFLVSVSADCNVVFRDCVFFGAEGSVLSVSGAAGLFENCTFYSGAGGSVLTSPQLILAYGPLYSSTSPVRGALTFRDCTVIAGTSSVRTATAARPVCQFGANVARTSVGVTHIDGLKIRYLGTTEIHRAETLLLFGGTQTHRYSNISIDFDGKTTTTAGVTNGPFAGSIPSFVTACTASGGTTATECFYLENISLENIGNPASGLGKGFIGLDRGIARGVVTQANGDGSNSWDHEICVYNGVSLRDYRSNTATMRISNAILRIQGNNNEVIGAEIQGGPAAPGLAFAGTPPTAVVNFVGNTNHLVQLRASILGNISNPVIGVNARDCTIHGGYVITAGTPTGAPIFIGGAAVRRTLLTSMHVVWNATTVNAITLQGADSIVDNCTFFQSAGATAAINNTGTGNTVTPNITSNVL